MKHLRKSTKTKKFVNKGSSLQRLLAVVVIIVVAIVGYKLLTASHAASPYVAVDASTGTVASPATKQACSGADNSNCVTFKAGTSSSNLGSILGDFAGFE